MQESFTPKIKAVKFSVLCETTSLLSKNLREMKTVKRKLLLEFTEAYCEGKKSVAKQRMKTFFDSKSSLVEDGDSDADSLSVLEQLYDIEMDIQCTSKDVKAFNQKKNAKEVNLATDETKEE